MLENNSLIKNEKISFWNKIKTFFKGIFGNKEKNSTIDKPVTDNNLRKEFEEEKRILNIQERYEKGELQEELISEEDKQKLMQLYKKQIHTLETNVENYKRELECYRTKILEVKNNIN